MRSTGCYIGMFQGGVIDFSSSVPLPVDNQPQKQKQIMRPRWWKLACRVSSEFPRSIV